MKSSRPAHRNSLSTASASRQPKSTGSTDSASTGATRDRSSDKLASVHPKKRGRPFKQNLTNVCRVVDASASHTNEAAGAANSPRPPRRVKSDIRYHTSDDSDAGRSSPKRRAASPPKRVTFQCQMCPTVFKRQGWLKVHMRKAHSDPSGGHRQPLAAATNTKVDSDSDYTPSTTPAVAVTAVSASTAGAGAVKPESSTPHHERLECGPCALRFNRQSAFVQHQRTAHARETLPQNVAAPLGEIGAIKAFFDSLNPQHSNTIAVHLDQMFKQTSKLMQWLKRQTALPSLPDFETVNECQRELLAKQLKLYDSASQMIAAKRDSLKFAYDDFVQKHGGHLDEEDDVDEAPVPAAVQADEDDDFEDYSSRSLHSARLNLDLSMDGQTIVGEPTETTPVNGHRASVANDTTSARRLEQQQQQQHQSTQTGGDVSAESSAPVSEIRIKDGDEFEFLDSKTGKLFSNKSTATDDDDDDADDADDDELVELIEVDEDF